MYSYCAAAIPVLLLLLLHLPRHFSAQNAAIAANMKIPQRAGAKYRLSMSMGSKSRLPSPCVKKSATCCSTKPVAKKASLLLRHPPEPVVGEVVGPDLA